jgi:predicted XRE-type DNA-binding protein/predicted RNase H-like HicB family nuclease
MTKQLSVEYRQDPQTSWWTATVTEESALVTQGKTLREARAQVRRALSCVRTDADELSLRGRTVWDHRSDLPPKMLAMLARAADLRVQSLDVDDDLDRVTSEAVHELLNERKLSYRATGQLLGITHQRVEQIAKRELQA